MINVLDRKCQMNFGVAKYVDTSGENNLTHGIEPHHHDSFECNNNQQPKYTA